MFISHKSAQKRLSSRQNRLRSEFVGSESNDAPVSGVSLDIDVVDELASDPDIMLEDEEDEEENGSHASAFDPSLDELLDSDKLDKLINLNPAIYHPYRGKLEAQVGIAQTSLLLGSTAAGNIFGISKQQCGSYDDGRRTTSLEKVNPELEKRVRKLKLELQEVAADRLHLTLGMLNEEKLRAVTKATDLSRIAKDMAGVLDRVSEKDQKDPGGTHFHIYRPEIKQETNYQTVQVGVKPDAAEKGNTEAGHRV